MHHLIRAGPIDGEEIVDPVIPFEQPMDRYLPIVTDTAGSNKLGVACTGA